MRAVRFYRPHFRTKWYYNRKIFHDTNMAVYLFLYGGYQYLLNIIAWCDVNYFKLLLIFMEIHGIFNIEI